MNNKVLACIDHSSYSLSICDYAAWASVRLHAPLEFIHVLDRHPEKAQRLDFSGSIGLGTQENLLEDLAAMDEKRSKLAQESGRQLVEAAKARAASAGVAWPEGRQRHGELVETLLEVESQVRLYVLGKRGEAAEAAPQHIGSNLERVVRTVIRPMLIAPHKFSPPENFLIAFDGSLTTRKIVEMVAASPLLRGLPCHIVMAGTATAAAKEAMAWAQKTMKDAGFNIVTKLASGNAEIVLSDYIRQHGIDMLVMGAYGHSRIRNLLVGSTTTTMLRTVAIPVLLLR